MLVGLVAFCFLGPLVHHTNQNDVQRALLSNAEACPCAPSAAHPLGTDAAGFDVLGRLMIAGRNSLLVGIAVALLSSTIGVVYGASSAIAGGAIDTVMMRLLDLLLSVPALFLLLALVVVVRPSFVAIILIIAATGWLGQARIVRGEALAIRNREYVLAAGALGATRSRVLVRHVAPNAIDVILLNTTFAVADAILVLAALGYLGVGLPASRPDWGSMLGEGINYAGANNWWLVYPAGFCIVFTVIGCHLVGDALRNGRSGTA